LAGMVRYAITEGRLRQRSNTPYKSCDIIELECFYLC
jgi:hypothetical protein